MRPRELDKVELLATLIFPLVPRIKFRAPVVPFLMLKEYAEDELSMFPLAAALPPTRVMLLAVDVLVVLLRTRDTVAANVLSIAIS
jgi:hypothetical protein